MKVNAKKRNLRYENGRQQYKTSKMYSNTALGPGHEAVKMSGRCENKIKRNPITEESGMK
jgi:hypothetical protein